MGQSDSELEINQPQAKKLKAFYNITAILHNQHDSREIANHFLEEVVAISDAESGAICLHNFNTYQMELVSDYQLTDKVKEVLNCELMENTYVQFFNFHRTEFITKKITKLLDRNDLRKGRTNQPNYFHLFPIVNTSENLGILILFSDKETIAAQTDEFLHALIEQLGIALIKAKITEQAQNTAILEERDQFARELHDSIAQSLTIIKLHIERLTDAFHNGREKEVHSSLNFLKSALEESIETVRDLLLDYRTPLKLTAFSHQLAELIHRFQTLTDITLESSIHTQDLTLSQNERLEVVFILQEALANVHKHANATLVTLQIYTDAENQVIILTDNGLGFDKQAVLAKSFRHIGLEIMQERAKKIQAKLNISSRLNKGTIITLKIPKHR